MTEITPSFIYWITRLDGIKIFFVAISIFSMASLIIFIITSVCAAEYKNDEYRRHIKGFKISLSIFLISIFSAIFIPNTKQMCAIYVIPKIINNEKIQEVGKEFYNLALDWMKEMHPSKSSENKKVSK